MFSIRFLYGISCLSLIESLVSSEKITGNRALTFRCDQCTEEIPLEQFDLQNHPSYKGVPTSVLLDHLHVKFNELDTPAASNLSPQHSLSVNFANYWCSYFSSSLGANKRAKKNFETRNKKQTLLILRT